MKYGFINEQYSDKFQERINQWYERGYRLAEWRVVPPDARAGLSSWRFFGLMEKG